MLEAIQGEQETPKGCLGMCITSPDWSLIRYKNYRDCHLLTKAIHWGRSAAEAVVWLFGFLTETARLAFSMLASKTGSSRCGHLWFAGQLATRFDLQPVSAVKILQPIANAPG